MTGEDGTPSARSSSGKRYDIYRIMLTSSTKPGQLELERVVGRLAGGYTAPAGR